MQELLATGVEARLLPQRVLQVNGENVVIPPHWAALSVFGGVSSRGAVQMWSAMTGSVSANDTIESARAVVNDALRHFPIDGCDLLVRKRQVCSHSNPQLLCPLRAYHLWVPPEDIFEGSETLLVEGRVVGLGVGFETNGKDLHAVPYLGVLIYEKYEDGRDVPLVAPARWVPPFDASSRIVADDPPTAQLVPELVEKLKGAAPFGSYATVAIHRTHYSLEDLYQDTVLGTAFKEARVPTYPVLEAQA